MISTIREITRTTDGNLFLKENTIAQHNTPTRSEHSFYRRQGTDRPKIWEKKCESIELYARHGHPETTKAKAGYKGDNVICSVPVCRTRPLRVLWSRGLLLACPSLERASFVGVQGGVRAVYFLTGRLFLEDEAPGPSLHGGSGGF